ncbi:unnamed protein product [Diatraea saccharalis]|uniref:unspecific monooxygenase n=1 Tax=Diatraea saccharalis TaxID=40085 RepID=A0A9N9R6W3_9NEOP|nr:unnamed protein product [Diatraea saccharalis]
MFSGIKSILLSKSANTLSVYQILSKSGLQSMYQRFKSPYIGIWLFWRPALIINSPEIAQRVLIKDFDVFRNRLLGSGSSKVDPIAGLNLFMVNEPTWSKMRRPLTSLFTSAKIKTFHNLYNTKTKDLVRRIAQSLDENKPNELRNMFSDFTTDIIGIAAFGVESNATITGDGPLRSITKDFMKFSALRGFAFISVMSFLFSLFIKFYLIMSHVDLQMLYTAAVLNENFSVVYEILVFLNTVSSLTFVNVECYAISSQNHLYYLPTSYAILVMDEDLFIAQAVIMLQGGFDTTSAAMSFFTYELAHCSEVKLYKELTKAKEDLGEKELDASVLSELVYFNCVIKETLKKYTSMGWLDRICDRDYRIDDNLTISKGTTVYVNSMGMHGDPEIYYDPDNFHPERFLPENWDSKKPFMPFGEGPRSCIGRRFAYRTMWYGLSKILLMYELKPIPGSKRPNDVKADSRSLFLVPGEDIFVKFVPRERINVE